MGVNKGHYDILKELIQPLIYSRVRISRMSLPHRIKKEKHNPLRYNAITATNAAVLHIILTREGTLWETDIDATEVLHLTRKKPKQTSKLKDIETGERKHGKDDKKN